MDGCQTKLFANDIKHAKLMLGDASPFVGALVANGVPRADRYGCGHTASPSYGSNRSPPASHNSAARWTWTFLIKPCQGSLIILDQ